MSVYSIRHTRSALHLLMNQIFGSRLRSDSSFIVLAIFYKMLHSRVDHKLALTFVWAARRSTRACNSGSSSNSTISIPSYLPFHASIMLRKSLNK